MNPILVLVDSMETAKETALWGTFGPDSKGPLRYVRLVDCSTEHLQAILETQRQITYHPYRVIISSILMDRGVAAKAFSKLAEDAFLARWSNTRSTMMALPTLTWSEERLIKHCLGVNRKQKKPYRNYFNAGEGHADMPTIQSLIAKGAMFQSAEHKDYYHVTPAGRAAAGITEEETA